MKVWSIKHGEKQLLLFPFLYFLKQLSGSPVSASHSLSFISGINEEFIMSSHQYQQVYSFSLFLEALKELSGSSASARHSLSSISVINEAFIWVIRISKIFFYFLALGALSWLYVSCSNFISFLYFLKHWMI